MCPQEERHLHPKWRALTHIHTEEEASYSSWSPPMLDAEYFQQGSWKQNLFAFLHSTFNFLLSFVSVGISPYFILCLLSLCERDFHWNSCSQGPAPMQGQKIIGRPIYPAVLFIFLFLLPSSSPPTPTQLRIDHGRCKMTAVSCALALQMKWKKKKWSFSVLSHRPAVWAGRERLSFLTRCCQDTVGRGDSSVVSGFDKKHFQGSSISLLIELFYIILDGFNVWRHTKFKMMVSMCK